MAFIEARELTHVYCPGSPFEKCAINGINIDIDKGELIGIIGHTGSGKSTFIQHLNGLLLPTTGKLYVDGEEISRDKAAQRRARSKVGLVFQYPEYQLFEETVYADIAFGPKNMGLSGDELDATIKDAARFAGVSESLFNESPLELSGGQKRRVAIAGVIAMKPGVLVLDEPAAGLDPVSKDALMERLCSYRDETGSAVIIVSHSMEDVAKHAERIVVFKDAAIAMDGTPESVFSKAEELSAMGLSVPAPTKVAMALRARGIEISDSIYTTKYLARLLSSLKKEGGAC